MEKIKRPLLTLILGLVITMGLGATSHASCVSGEQACSSTYAVGQVFFGSGGTLDTTCSSTYCAKQSLGETGVGLTSSSTYQAYAGFNVDREPYLQFQVNATNIDMGVLSSGSTATAKATFSVKSYLSSGYSVITASPSPSNGSYNMKTPNTPTASAAGTEQFGINLVGNTTTCGAPANFGADPVQVPNSSYSYGVAASGYNSCGLFQYVPNSVIASSSKSSGETDYTISYIMNINSVTPDGEYTMNDVLIAVPTF